jgi:fluoroacetyl-CoA thioesterase
MKPGLSVGATSALTYRVPPSKTVRHIYTEAPEFARFPEVFATGFFVALMEWACTDVLKPYLEPTEGSLGIKMDMTHEAATPPGFDVTVTTTVTFVEPRKVGFDVVGHDGIDLIGRGAHVRAVIDRARFDQRLAEKVARARAQGKAEGGAAS